VEAASWGHALPLGDVEPAFQRGLEVGVLWAGLLRESFAEATVHADAAEHVIRLAEHLGLPFHAYPLDESATWLAVTVGAQPDAEPDAESEWR
jgi:hypothetical protein